MNSFLHSMHCPFLIASSLVLRIYSCLNTDVIFSQMSSRNPSGLHLPTQLAISSKSNWFLTVKHSIALKLTFRQYPAIHTNYS